MNDIPVPSFANIEMARAYASVHVPLKKAVDRSQHEDAYRRLYGNAAWDAQMEIRQIVLSGGDVQAYRRKSSIFASMIPYCYEQRR